MFTLWVAPYLLHTVSFVETFVISYGPSRGAAIFCWIPSLFNKTLFPTLFSFLLDLLIISSFLRPICAQLALKLIGESTSPPNTNCLGVALRW